MQGTTGQSWRWCRAVKTGLPVVALTSVLGGSTEGANVPIALTAGSYTADVIIENSPTPTLTRSFGSNRAYVEEGYTDAVPTTATPGLPVATTGSSVQYTSAATGTGTIFQFQPYEQNNALFLPNSNTPIVGLMSLVTPQRFEKLSVAATASDAGTVVPNVTITLIFDSGPNVSATFAVPDWNNGGTAANRALAGLDRVNVSNSTLSPIVVNNENRYVILEQQFNLADFGGGDQTGRTLTGVQFSQDRAGTAATSFSTPAVAIFGISGTAVPEPGSVAVLSALATGLLVRRRRAM